MKNSQIIREASQAADEIRRGVFGGTVFPVDPVSIASKLGIKVLETDLPDNVSGAIFKDKEKDPVIVVHHEDSDQRKRFSCAHEIGHFIYRLKNEENDGEYDYVDLRGERSRTGLNKEEIFANQFAATLLMPENEFLNLVKKGKDSVLISLYFGVSPQAVKVRLENIKNKKNEKRIASWVKTTMK